MFKKTLASLSGITALLWIILGLTGCLNSPAHDAVADDTPRPVDYSGYSENAPLELVLQDGHSNSISTVRYSPDGSLIVSGSADKTLKLWTSEGKLLRTFSPGASGIGSVDFSPDGRFLVHNSDTDVSIRGLDGSLLRSIPGDENIVLQTAFSPAGDLIAVGKGNGTVEIRDMSGKIMESYKKHDGMVLSLRFSPDGRRLASGGWNKTKHIQEIKLYTLGGRDIQRFDAAECGDSFLFSNDGNYLIFAENTKSDAIPGGTLKIRGLSEKYERDINLTGRVSALAISRNDEMIAAGTHQGSIVFMDLNGNRIDNFQPWKRWTVKSIDFSPDGKSLVYAAGGDVPMEEHSISIVDLVEMKAFDIRGYMDPLLDMAVSPSGDYIAQGSGNTIKLWDIPNNTVRTFTGYGRAVKILAFDEKERYLLGSDGNQMILRDLRGTVISKFGKRGAGYTDAGFIAGTGNILCATYDSGIELRNIEGNLLELYSSSLTRETMSMSVSPVGTHFITTGSDEKIYLWKIDGTHLRSYPGQGDDVLSLDFSPDGTRFVSGSRDGSVRLWDIESGLLHSFSGFDDTVASVAFSSDGKFFAGGGADKTIQVWRNDTFSRVFNDSCDNGIVAISFLPGHSQLLCAEGDYSLSLRNFLDENSGILSLTAFSNGEWFGRLSTGIFDCSSSGYEYLHFVKGLEILSPEQFWEGFYFPDLLPAYLAGGELPQGDINTTTDTIPVVSMGINRPYGNEDPRTEVSVTAEGSTAAQGQFFLLHNGRKIDENTRGLELAGSGRSRTFSVQLVEGKNILQAGIYNTGNTAYGISEAQSLFFTPPAIESPDMYILAVGVSSYLDSSINLGSPAGDAKELSSALGKLGDNLYDRVEVSTLLDRNAVKENILGQLETLSQETEEIDAVILFLAGHGYVQEGTYYFLPYDVDILDLEKSAVSIDSLNRLIGGIPARKIAVFFDTCRSGSAVKSLGMMAMTRSIDEKREIASLAKAQGIAVFSASAADQYAYEIPTLGNGIFTHSLLQALESRQSEISIEGKISLGKLLASVNRITRDTAWTYLGVEQSPAMYVFGDDFYLGRY